MKYHGRVLYTDRDFLEDVLGTLRGKRVVGPADPGGADPNDCWRFKIELCDGGEELGIFVENLHDSHSFFLHIGVVRNVLGHAFDLDRLRRVVANRGEGDLRMCTKRLVLAT